MVNSKIGHVHASSLQFTAWFEHGRMLNGRGNQVAGPGTAAIIPAIARLSDSVSSAGKNSFCGIGTDAGGDAAARRLQNLARPLAFPVYSGRVSEGRLEGIDQQSRHPVVERCRGVVVEKNLAMKNQSEEKGSGGVRKANLERF